MRHCPSCDLCYTDCNHIHKHDSCWYNYILTYKCGNHILTSHTTFAHPWHDGPPHRYTLDNYSLIVRFKTAYYSFYMPVACGMLLAGVPQFRHCRWSSCLASAAYDVNVLGGAGGWGGGVQDDFLDAYGDPAVTGKLGSDIEDNKCSWLICVALLHASVSQRDAIRTNYGRKDAEAVAAVKRVYSELELGRRFREYEEQTYQRLCSAIESQVLLPKEVFMSLLRKIYKRVK
eukprot:361840-Chlamydomonas_euryale.AAC.10